MISMDQSENQKLQDTCLIMQYCKDNMHGNWVIMEDDLEDTYNNISSSSLSMSSIVNSDTSNESLSPSELIDDASSSSTSCSTFQSNNGPLYELSELITQLPIKRGLSKYYQGKSQSFTSLARVTSSEDLAKKVYCSSFSKKMKACKSYAGGGLEDINNKAYYTLPKSIISEKPSKGSLNSLVTLNRSSFMSAPIPLR